MPHRLPYRFAVCAAAVFLLAGCLFAAAYHYDNKYLFGPPYGADGVIEVSDDDLDRPVPLVDGWMLSVDGGPRTETFIASTPTSPTLRAERRLSAPPCTS